MLKRELQARADELNIDYKQNNTKAELKEMIKEAESSLESNEEKEKDNKGNDKETKKESDKEVLVKAKRNTFLPDGNFVKKGQTITVSKSYSEIIKQEQNSAFKIIK